jgi:chromosome segregation ATPase
MLKQFTPYALASLFLVFGCENAADQQKEANGAQAEANRAIDRASREAQDKVVAAQAEADRKIAEANSDFQKLREDFRHKTTENLVAVDRKIAELEADAKDAKGKAKLDLEARLPTIHQLRESFANSYRSIETASTSSWDSVKAGLDKQWEDLKKAVDDADD